MLYMVQRPSSKYSAFWNDRLLLSETFYWSGHYSRIISSVQTANGTTDNAVTMYCGTLAQINKFKQQFGRWRHYCQNPTRDKSMQSSVVQH